MDVSKLVVVRIGLMEILQYFLREFPHSKAFSLGTPRETSLFVFVLGFFHSFHLHILNLLRRCPSKVLNWLGYLIVTKHGLGQRCLFPFTFNLASLINMHHTSCRIPILYHYSTTSKGPIYSISSTFHPFPSTKSSLF